MAKKTNMREAFFQKRIKMLLLATSAPFSSSDHPVYTRRTKVKMRADLEIFKQQSAFVGAIGEIV